MTANNLDIFSDVYKECSPFDRESFLSFAWYVGRIMALSPTGDLLELGIGHGQTSTLFSSFYDRHVVVEGSNEVIRQYRERYASSKAIIFESTFEAFDTKDRFDVIVMGFILEHVDDPALILKRFQRFLKPNGLLYITVPNAASLHRRLGQEAGLLQNIYQLSAYDLRAGHRRYYDMETICAQVEACGYKILRSEGLFLKPLSSDQLRLLNLSEDVYQAMFKVGVSFPEICNAILLQAASKIIYEG